VADTVNPFKPQMLTDLLVGSTDVEWVLEPFIPPQGSALLAGHSGSGKTWLGLDIALAVATGDPWLGRFSVKQGTVLIVDEENSELLLRVRLHKLLKGRQIDPKDIPLYFLVNECVNLSPTLSGNKIEYDQSYRRLGATIADIQPRLVIFDSLTRVHRANENSANEIAQVFTGLKLFTKLGMSCLMIHHFRKSGASVSGDRIRGSADIRAFFDTTMLVNPSNGRCRIEHDKPRWSEKRDPFFVNFTNHDDDAFTITYGGEEGDPTGPGVKMQRTWDIIRRQFQNGHLVKRQELRDATRGVCSVRYLDETLKWATDEGWLNKGKDPEDKRQTVFRLTSTESLHPVQ
jgi:hypothetical protein